MLTSRHQVNVAALQNLFTGTERRPMSTGTEHQPMSFRCMLLHWTIFLTGTEPERQPMSTGTERRPMNIRYVLLYWTISTLRLKCETMSMLNALENLFTAAEEVTAGT